MQVGDLRLVGTTESIGGHFGQVKIVGECRLNGKVECGSFTCTGTSEVMGDFKAGLIKLTGELTVNGSFAVERGATTGEVRVRGGSRGDRLKVTGQLSVEGDCEYESLQATGAVQVDGLLGAETLELRLHGPSRAREVGGGRIQIKRSRMASIKKLFVSAGPISMAADLIEGDILDLEYTFAKVVRGNQVRLGPGCEIERVEYRQKLSKSGGAKVGTEAKIE
ncbi:hypothetical protein [Cohnella zeiphila]|uniref:Polymer-forming cytoskeletal protein n=1 Tax=Cohnella zeiphila TaxID=2761120 RepID=A0A7X0SRP3_9BACL|nr:hypothetical protein [Cohnella zeiphila]MBB6734877.1 hypothetical protein [Cohnella zeiphila]